MKIFMFVFILFLMGLSHSYGFKQGVESSDFDRAHANNKLVQCQEVIYAKKIRK